MAMNLQSLRKLLEPLLRRAFHLYWRFARGMTLGVRAVVLDGEPMPEPAPPVEVKMPAPVEAKAAVAAARARNRVIAKPLFLEMEMFFVKV